MKEFLAKVWCFILGHDIKTTFDLDNGRSKITQFECLRCGKEWDRQYDYGF